MNITKQRSLWFSISSILVLASLLISLIFGLNLGLDYTGGIRWQVAFDEPATAETVNKFFADAELEKAPLVQVSDNNQFLITLEELESESFINIKDSLTTTVGTYEEISYRKVNSSIGSSFKRKALYALLSALIGIIFFVAWAFRTVPAAISPWRFGSVAIIALFHDILIVFGIFVVLGHFIDVELDLTFITALLATLGFSVNDTIVILDRVRENIRLQKPTETFEDTVEKSVKQTLSRSINTSISTLLPLLGLLFLGAQSIFFFVLALTIGIVVGTYSSIFLAAPMLVSLKNLADRK